MIDTLANARRWLMSQMLKGADCPCCGQNCYVYPRQVHSTMAKGLILMYKAVPPGEWFNLPDVMRSLGRSRGGDEAKLAYWGLIESDDGQREDGSNRTGWWRITDLGRRFVLGEATITKHAMTFNKQTLWFQGPQISIIDALGTKFNYLELMNGPEVAYG